MGRRSTLRCSGPCAAVGAKGFKLAGHLDELFAAPRLPARLGYAGQQAIVCHFT
jgi:hypothetical protein